MHAASPPAPPEALPTRQVLVVFSGLLLAMLLAALDSTIVATALPTIVGELGGLARLGWVVTAYLLAQTIVTPLYGKLGDLYGRKIVLQSGIVIFLLGSALCGLSRGMNELILFRAIQGLGGGGLMVTTQAVVGDIVTPRERGRYQGIFGAVFGVASIAGPLIGGYFTTHLSWRWIFYINLPLGLLALIAIAVTLPRRPERVRHAIDYAGTMLLAGTLTSVVLVTDVGGVTLSWTSPAIVGLVLVAIVSLALFIIVERRAAEPVLPLGLFANPTFGLSAAIGLIVGFALFGSVTFLPLFLQVVNGATPTGSGLQLLPLMGGMLLTSIASGQLISRRGRYKIFPVMGTGLMVVALYLLSTMDALTSVPEASLYMLLLGAGLGMVMQVLVIAVQNAVDYAELGVATSGTTLFRLIGGSFGTAVFGAIFAGRLASILNGTVAGETISPSAGGLSPAALAELPPEIRSIYVGAFTAALGTVFLTAMFVALVGFATTWFMPEKPLRQTISATAADLGRQTEEVFPLPTDAPSLFRIERALSVVASQEAKREYVERVIARVGIDLSPSAGWLLVVLGSDPSLEPRGPGRVPEMDEVGVSRALRELREKGLVVDPYAPDGGVGASGLVTHAGCELFDRIAEARRHDLTRVLEEWAPERRRDFLASFSDLPNELVPDMPDRREAREHGQ